MTVSSEIKRADYTGNGSTTAFATQFRFLQNSDVKVILTVTATALETEQVEITNYTLTGADLDAGGTVTMLIAPAVGETLTIKRDVPLTQGTDYVENDTFPAESHEDALDKLTMLVQQLQEEIDRSIKLTESQTSTGLTIPIPIETNILQWDANDDLKNIDPITLGIINNAVVARTFKTKIAMVADSGLKVGDKVRTLGFTLEGDGGDNDYLIVTSGTGTDDNGRFIDLTGITGQAKGLFPDNEVNSKQFGVDVSPASETTALNNASVFANSISVSLEILPGAYSFPTGNFAFFKYHSYGTVTSDNPSVLVNNLDTNLVGTYNQIKNYDDDAGSVLTLANDEDLGRIRRIDYALVGDTVDDGTPAINPEVLNKATFQQFRISAVITGDPVLINIDVNQQNQDTATSVVLTVGQISTPFAAFRAGSQAYLRVKKGTGQGKIGVEYQFQDPKTKLRTRTSVWVIDLDDGQTVRNYDIILPECSTATMLGHYKLGDTTGLNWVFKAITGPVEIVSFGVNPVTGTSTRVHTETVDPATLPTSGQYRTPYLTGWDLTRVIFRLAQTVGGNSTVISDIKVEIDV